MQLLEGHFLAADSALLCRNYRYVVERMMRIMGGWIALTPELSAKLLLGRHVWDNAQHADAWGKRLPELRAPAQESEAANAAVVAFMDAIEEPEARHETVERLVGVYRVLKPHLLRLYTAHLERANPVYEPPTRRILTRCIEDERRHIEAGETIVRHLAKELALQARARAWQAKLEKTLEAAGGVTGEGLPPSASMPPPQNVSLSDDGREFIRLEQSVIPWTIPGDLAAGITRFGDALIRAEARELGGLLPGAPDEAVMAALRTARLASHRTVAFAKLGRYRLVKYRLEGPEGAVVLNARWEHGEAGWRVGAVEIVKTEHAQPL